MSKHTVLSASEALMRNGAIFEGKGVYMASPGIKSLGQLDYLIKYNGYHRLAEPPKKSAGKRTETAAGLQSS